MPEVADRSGWIETAGTYRSYASLTGLQKTDWLIIGGGLTGLSAAHRLARLRPKDRIVLIDAKRIAQGASGRNSGFVVGNTFPEELGYGIGRQAHRPEAQIRLDQVAGEGVKALIAEHGIACDYVEKGFHYAAHDPALFPEAERYAEAIASAGGKAKALGPKELTERFGIPFYNKGLWIGGSGSGFLHSAKFSKGLADALPKPVEVFENSRVSNVRARSGGGAVAELDNGASIEARKVIVGLNALLPRFGYKRDRIFPVALSASLTRPLTADEEARINHAEPWALLSPVKGGTTIRLTPDRRLLVRNTAEYRPEGIDTVRLAERQKKHIHAFARRFPWLPADAIAYTWTCSICISRNGRFVFEEMQPSVYAAACYNGTGVTRATLLGRLIAEHAAGEPSDLVPLALSLDKPTMIPPGALFRPLVAARFHFEHMRARPEA